MSSNQTTETDSDNELKRQNSVVTNIFGKPRRLVRDRVREQTSFFAFKVKIFIALHKPFGFAKLYHFIVLLIIFFSVIALNIFDEELSNEGVTFDTNFTYFKILTDTSIIIILCIELVLRNWSCDVINDYVGFRGKLLYWRHYIYTRTLDVFGIITFVSYIVNHITVQDVDVDSLLRILHLTQVLQLYRLLYRFLKVIIDTVLYQKNQLVIVLILMCFALIFTAFCVYLTERESNSKINTIFDAFWMTFVTFTTIGYGDTYPTTGMGKILVIICGSVGVVFFALPGGILGTGLALKIEEDERKSETHRIVAAKLIQYVWRSYASNKRSQSGANWKLYRRRDGQEMTAEDRACVRFIRIVLYLKQRHRFKVLMGLINDDNFRQRSVRELSRMLRLTENDVKSIGNNINKTLEKKTKTNDIMNKLKIKLTQIKDKEKVTKL